MATLLEEAEPIASVELTQLPERYEIVNGQVVELPDMSFYATVVANVLKEALDQYLLTSKIGRCWLEALFEIPLPEDSSRNRRPDLSFVSFERWGKKSPIPSTGNALDVVPDIAVEVVSPGDSADDLIAKAREYLTGGVRLVWLVYPLAQEVHAYRSDQTDVKVYLASIELEAGEILPGFRTSVADLFPPTEPRSPKI